MNEMNERRLTISCDDCSMQCTAACDDCVVSFVLRDDGAEHGSVVSDLAEARAVRLLSDAGLVPDLKFRETG